MATAKLKPLPPDYARPSLAEYLAASKTHTADTYLPFVNGHEAELRRHYVAPPAEPEAAPVPDAGDPSEAASPEADPELELVLEFERPPCQCGGTIHAGCPPVAAGEETPAPSVEPPVSNENPVENAPATSATSIPATGA
jgi:hypothetical protein